MTNKVTGEDQKDKWAGRYFVAFAGRSKFNLPFPVVNRYGKVVGKLKAGRPGLDDVYSVES